VFEVGMEFLRTGPGIKIADSLKLTMLISSGTGMFETSWAVSHTESS
jgi:hypothetical protein